MITTPASIQPEQYPPGLTTSELGHALRGEKLSHFLLQELIGGGGMGVVFKAHDTTLNRTVAVKVLASQRLSSIDLKRRFEVEAQSAARLDHPNIARVYESGVERGLPFIVFEFIEGTNLRDVVVRHGPMPIVEALRCTYHAALALAHAQERDVIHRDIKPSNILLTTAGETKLIDMGLARLRPTNEEEELTATGMTLGTFDYISPEQAKDPRDADVRSDIYSLGCTLYFMLTGRAPFSEGTAVQKLMQHQTEQPPEVRRLRPDASPQLSLLIRSMLAKSPEGRPQTPTELAAILGEMLQDLGVALSAAPAPITWRPAVDRWTQLAEWRPWAIALIILLLATAAVDRMTRSVETSPFAPVRFPAEGQPAERAATPEPAVDSPRASVEGKANEPDARPTAAPTIASEPLDLLGGALDVLPTGELPLPGDAALPETPVEEDQSLQLDTTPPLTPSTDVEFPPPTPGALDRRSSPDVEPQQATPDADGSVESAEDPVS